MKELIQKVVDWANARNLIQGSTPEKQGLKLMSEYGELCDAIAKGNLDGIKDGIGDVAVVAIIINQQFNPEFVYDGYNENAPYEKHDEFQLAKELVDLIFDIDYLETVFCYLNSIATHHGFTLEECLSHAYEEIKDRKGVMYQGVFIKESDERYVPCIHELAFKQFREDNQDDWQEVLQDNQSYLLAEYRPKQLYVGVEPASEQWNKLDTEFIQYCLNQIN